ncbi:MAG TPA: DUF1801 domain-containing protein [Anaerolineales bacterium]
MTVDEFVESIVLPELRDVVEHIRAYIRELAPEVQEVFSYGMPCYKRNRIFAWISPSKKHITFGFSHGKHFEDKYSRLKGVGRSSRHLQFKATDEVNKDIFEYYLHQALEADSN